MPMSLHKKLARLCGYEMIRLKKHPSLEAHLEKLIEAKAINLVLDVGANRGQFAQRLRQQGYRGEIHSFEPVSHSFAAIQRASGGDSNWHVHQLALGAENGEAVINVTEFSELTSFLQFNDFGRKEFEQASIQNQETVQVVTLDKFLAAELPGFRSKNILLKMDTQGFDLQVFAGAQQSLDAIDVLVSELSLTPIYEGMPHYLEVLKIYENAGFAVTGLYPITRKADFALIEMDCVMIKR